MGKHTRIQDRDLGGMTSTFSALDDHTLPPIRTLRMVLRHYERTMQGVGLDPDAYDDQARLIIGPCALPIRWAGWFLPAGPRHQGEPR